MKTSFSRPWLCQYSFDYLSADVGQAEVPALEAVSQALVVDSQAVKNGRLKIVHVDGIFDDVVAVVVGFAEGNPRLHAAAGEPHGEAAAVMVPSVIGRGQVSLTVDGSAEFSAPDHQRVLQHAALRQGRL